MATKIQHKRTSTFSAAWPTLAPGELAFNGPQLKIALGDPNTGAPLELLAVRFFSTTSSYATNDFIATAGTLLRAVHAVAPGPFNAADWAGAAAGVPEAPIDGKAYLRQNAAWAAATLASIGAVEEAPNDGKAYSRKSIAWAQLTATDVTYGAGSVSDALGNMITPAQMTSDNVTNTSGVPGVTVSNALVGLQGVDATKAPLASPAFTGTPTAPTPPAADNSTKVPTTAWVQSLSAGKASIVTSDVPPATPNDNSLWWESDTAKLYLRYNDGNSSQWVQVNAAAGMGGYVTKIGDTMTGPLILSGDPTLPLGAVTKQYSDTKPSTTYVDTQDNLRLPKVGVTDGSNAPAGQVGEYITAARLSGSPLALTTVVAANVTSISLTAGDWDIWGNVGYVVAAGTITNAIYASLNSVSATFPASHLYSTVFLSGAAGTNNGVTLQPPPQRFSFAATTTLYLLAQAAFSGGTCSAYGFIAARRAR